MRLKHGEDHERSLRPCRKHVHKVVCSGRAATHITGTSKSSSLSEPAHAHQQVRAGKQVWHADVRGGPARGNRSKRPPHYTPCVRMALEVSPRNTRARPNLDVLNAMVTQTGTRKRLKKLAAGTDQGAAVQQPSQQGAGLS